jgi:hypothetical protein
MSLLSPSVLQYAHRYESVEEALTTNPHFVNAVVERDAARLARVAVIRLCGPFGKHALPCIDWPADMKELILGHHALIKGGLEGRLIVFYAIAISLTYFSGWQSYY